MGQGDNEWVVLYVSTSEQECQERVLVLQAVGIVHEVLRDGPNFVILVPAVAAELGRAELDAYSRENREGPEDRRAVLFHADGWSGVLAYGAMVLLVAVLAQRHALGADWFAAGKTNAGLIRAGQWWRTVTALTLHADPAHLLANLLVGGLVGLYAGQTLGNGFAWFCILVAGAAGNFLNACIRPAEHTSVGASTAVFAALGLLAASALRQRRTRRTSTMERWAPLVGGAVLLSLLGTGGERTDVAAHVLGFVCGAGAGAMTGKLGRGVFGSRAQFLFGLAVLTILAVAWTVALVHHARDSLI